jgi:hypothetical protein
MRVTHEFWLAAVCAVAIAGTAEAGAVKDAKPKGAANPQGVTVAGCLTHDEDSYRLTRVSGSEAPRSRSWRSLYVKKNAPTLEIVDTDPRLNLKDHVGRTVKVTGTMNGQRRIRARAVQRVSSSCK